MPYLESKNGIHWNYEIAGEGENLLFIHGWGGDGKMWRQQIKRFSDSYRVISIDLPGHGASGWHPVSLAQICEDIQSLLKKEEVADVSIVSSSLGGLIALKMFDLYPDTIRRLSFVGSLPKFSKTPEYPYGLDLNDFRVLDGQLQTHYPNVVNVFFRSLFTNKERATRRYKWIMRFRKDGAVPDRDALWIYLDILEKTDLRDVLSRVQVPVQFVNGLEDAICPPQSVDFLKKLLPGARFDLFEDCGHFPFLSKPYEFNDVLDQFLTEKQDDNDE